MNNIYPGTELSGSANAVSTISNTTSSPSPGPTAPPKNPSGLDKYAGSDWSIDDFRTLMLKYKCGMCRKDDRVWTKCDIFKNWSMTKKDSHPRSEENKSNSKANNEKSNSNDKAKSEKNKTDTTETKKAGSSSHVSFSTTVNSVPDYKINDDIKAIETANPFAPLRSPSVSPSPPDVDASEESDLTARAGTVTHTSFFIDDDSTPSDQLVFVFDEFTDYHMHHDSKFFLFYLPC